MHLPELSQESLSEPQLYARHHRKNAYKGLCPATASSTLDGKNMLLSLSTFLLLTLSPKIIVSKYLMYSFSYLYKLSLASTSLNTYIEGLCYSK